MTRVPLILAHEALRRLARIAARRAGIPAEASLSLRWGRWYVHEPQRRPTDYGLAVWPEGDGNGGGWSEYFDDVQRGAIGGECAVVASCFSRLDGPRHKA